MSVFVVWKVEVVLDVEADETKIGEEFRAVNEMVEMDDIDGASLVVVDVLVDETSRVEVRVLDELDDEREVEVVEKRLYVSS